MSNKEASSIYRLIMATIEGEPLTSDEHEMLQAWINADPLNQATFMELTDPVNLAKTYRNLYEGREQVAQKLSATLGITIEPAAFEKRRSAPIRKLNRTWIPVMAASILVLLSASWLVWVSQIKKDRPPKAGLVVANSHPEPGSTKATLILGDHKVIELDGKEAKRLDDQGGASLLQQPDQVTYNSTASGTNSAVYNQINTPNGGQFKILLEDGSKIWINAATSLRYPTVFSASIRQVELLEGEAYFEIAKDAKRPFIVKTTTAHNSPLEIQVLGTHFNISAYHQDGFTATTLIEGKVAVKARAGTQELKPGDQSLASGETDKIVIKQNINTKDIIAWTRGYFEFDKERIDVVLNKFARWYNLKVEYPNGKPSGVFSGIFKRQTSIDEIIGSMQGSGINITMQGNLVTILP